MDNVKITLLDYPTGASWIACKERALVTIKTLKDEDWGTTVPSPEWKRRILRARHSPIRCLRFSFYIEGIPYYTSVHLCRHVHAQPYVRSQRNDRQKQYDRTKAPQDAPVNMIWDMNAEELLTIANKRLCETADLTTREVVQKIVDLVNEVCPEFKPFLVPPCRMNGTCHEMNPCKRGEALQARREEVADDDLYKD